MAKKTIIIIGAGLAGLTAAYTIHKNNTDYQIIILEAKSSVGGRMITGDRGYEKGGEAIGSYYNSLHKIAKDVGAKMGYVSLSKMDVLFDLCYYINGNWIKNNEWESDPNNPIPKKYKHITPLYLMNILCSNIMKPKFWDYFISESKFSNMSFFDLVFLNKNTTNDMIPFIESNFELCEDSRNISALSALTKIWPIAYKFVPMKYPKLMPIFKKIMSYYYKIDNKLPKSFQSRSKIFFLYDGNGSLPIALSDYILNNGHMVKFNRVATDIIRKQTKYIIKVENGEEYYADKVIVAIPGNLVQNINFEPTLGGYQLEAFNTLNYIPSIKVFFKITKKFWTEDNMPVFMWLDSPLINVMIPIYDNAINIDDVGHPWNRDVWGIYAFSNGNKARMLNDMINQHGTEYMVNEIIKTLESIRPSMKNSLEYIDNANWIIDKYQQGGFPIYPPNKNVHHFYNQIATPFHDIYFAGDYTEYKYSGFNAAVESGIRAAKEATDSYNKYETKKKSFSYILISIPILIIILMYLFL